MTKVRTPLRLRRIGRRSDGTRSLDGTSFERGKPARIIPFPKRSEPVVQQLLSAKEAAQLVGIHEKTLRRLAGEGRIPGFRLDESDPRSDWRFDPSVLASYFKTRCWANLQEPLRSQVQEEFAKFQIAPPTPVKIAPSAPTLKMPIPRTNTG
jgi:excisionase family DNA binding protein